MLAASCIEYIVWNVASYLFHKTSAFKNVDLTVKESPRWSPQAKKSEIERMATTISGGFSFRLNAGILLCGSARHMPAEERMKRLL